MKSAVVSGVLPGVGSAPTSCSRLNTVSSASDLLIAALSLATIGAGVRGGVDVAYVAPVEVGDRAWTAAGSVVTQDVPPGALGVARERQRNVEGYDERRRSGGVDSESS